MCAPVQRGQGRVHSLCFVVVVSFFKNCIYLFSFFYFLATLGLCCCARAFSSCDKQGLLFIAVRRLLTVVASLVEHRL